MLLLNLSMFVTGKGQEQQCWKRCERFLRGHDGVGSLGRYFSSWSYCTEKSTLRGLFEMLETYSNLDNQADIQSLLHIECWHCISNFRQVFTSGQTLHNWRNKWCAVITIDYIYTSSLFNMQMNSVYTNSEPSVYRHRHRWSHYLYPWDPHKLHILTILLPNLMWNYVNNIIKCSIIGISEPWTIQQTTIWSPEAPLTE